MSKADKHELTGDLYVKRGLSYSRARTTLAQVHGTVNFSLSMTFTGKAKPITTQVDTIPRTAHM